MIWPMLRHITEGPTVLLYIHNGMHQFHITEGPTRSYHRGRKSIFISQGDHEFHISAISKWEQRHITPGPSPGTKPQKKRPISGKLDRTSQEAPHPRKSGQNHRTSAPFPEIRNRTSRKDALAVLGFCSDKLCRVSLQGR